MSIEPDTDLLASLLDDAVKLCPLPATTQRVIRLAASDRSSIPAIVQAISNDPALATQVLRVANSAMYTGPKLAQLDGAVIRIGLRELRDLSAALSLLASFRSRDGVQVILHDRCVLAGSVANALANATGLVAPSTASTIGLLCEIGAMVCLAVDGKDYALLWKEMAQAPLERLAHERMRYSVSSFEIGRRYLLRNSVPEEVCTAVGIEPDVAAESMSVSQKLCLLSRSAAPIVFAGSRVGAVSRLRDQLDVLSAQIGFANLDGKGLFDLLKDSGLLRHHTH